MKRLLCIVLTSAMLFLLSVSAFAEDTSFESPQDGALPVVVVRGMDFDALTVDPGDGTSRPALEADTGEIVSALFKAAVAGLMNFSMDKAVDSLTGFAKELCKYVACDKSGEPVYKSTVPVYPLSVGSYPELTGEGGYSEANIVKSAVARFGGERVYYCAYDWRESPLDVSDTIAAAVDKALLENNCDKVNLICASLGGIETVAYLTEYGYEKLNKCVFVSSTFYGVYLASDLLTGNIGVNADGLYNYLLDETKDSRVGTLAVKGLKAVGAVDGLSGLINGFIDKYKDEVYKGFVRDSFGYVPSFWALVQPEDYDEAVSFMFGDDLEGNAGFIALTRELQEMVAGRDALLKRAADDGVSIAVIAGYNTPSAPLYARGTENGDGTLETALMSGGATVAHFGKTLGGGYTAADPSMLSADKVVDASTCLFPNYTWFVKDGGHVACRFGSEYSDFLYWLVGFNGQPTVTDNTAYPRFMYTDGEQKLYALQ